MAGSMTRAALRDICEQVTDGTHDSPKLRPCGVPFIKGKHISGGRIDFGNCDFISEQDHAQAIRRAKPQMGDILLSNIGSIGNAAFVNTNVEFSIKNVALLRADCSKISPRYYYYHVTSRQFQNEITSKRSGVAQPFIALETIRDHEITFHSDLTIQRRIEGILSAYDDLIENNLRRIAILEEMAQAIYREWFVEFRYPGNEDVRMVDSALGMVPSGWIVKPLSWFGEVITGKTPSKRVPAYYGASMPFIKIPDMHGRVFCLETAEMLSELGVASQSNKTIPMNSICVSCIGTAGIVSIASTDSQTNQQINSIVPYSFRYREFLYLSLKALKDTIIRYGWNGATMVNLNKSKFEALLVLDPDSGTIDGFHAATRPIFDLICVLERSNIGLRCTRDLLLPRLVSGALDIEGFLAVVDDGQS